MRPNCPLCNDSGMNIGKNRVSNSLRIKGEELYKLRNSKNFPTSSKIQKIISRITNTKHKITQNKKDICLYRNISFQDALVEGLDTPKKLQSKIYKLRGKTWSLNTRLRKQYSELGAVPITQLIIPRIVNVNE